MGELTIFWSWILETSRKTFCWPPKNLLRMGTTALLEFECKLAHVLDICIVRSKKGGRRGKIQFLVFVFVNFVSKIALLMLSFVKFRPEMSIIFPQGNKQNFVNFCLLPCGKLSAV